MAASRGAGQGPSVRPEAGLAAVPLRSRPLPAWPRGVSSARPPQALRGRPVLSPYEAPSLSRTYCTHSCPLSMAGRPPRLTPLPPGEWLTCSAILSSVPPPPAADPTGSSPPVQDHGCPHPHGAPSHRARAGAQEASGSPAGLAAGLCLAKAVFFSFACSGRLWKRKETWNPSAAHLHQES